MNSDHSPKEFEEMTWLVTTKMGICYLLIDSWAKYLTGKCILYALLYS